MHIRVLILTKPTSMKKLLLATLLLGFAYSGFSAESQGVLDFRNIFWGTPKDSVWRDGKKLSFEKDRNSLIKNAYYLVGDDLIDRKSVV